MSAPNLHPAPGPEVIVEVACIVEARRRDRPSGSYVAGLLGGGPGAVREKVTEEALEVAQASKRGDAENLVHEVADLWFHTIVLLAAHGVGVERVFGELARRRK